jgi:protein-S-isoprenylcysteine O-methyltransferase Ste14
MEIICIITLSIFVIFGHSLFLFLKNRRFKKDLIRKRIHLPIVHILYYVVISLSIIFIFIFSNKMNVSHLQKLIAYPLIFSSLILVLVSRKQIGIFHSPHVEILKDHKLIQTGIYRYLDHPMYYFESSSILGISLLANHFIGYIAMFIWCLAMTMKIRAENRLLKSEFKEYMPLIERFYIYISQLNISS